MAIRKNSEYWVIQIFKILIHNQKLKENYETKGKTPVIITETNHISLYQYYHNILIYTKNCYIGIWVRLSLLEIK